METQKTLKSQSSLFFFLIFYLFYFLFLSALGLRCCVWAFSSCGAQASHCSAFSCWGAQALGAWASLVVARGLSSCGSQDLERRLSSCGVRA